MWHLAWIRIGKKSNTMKTRIINWCKTAVCFVHCQWEALELSTNSNFCSSTIKWMRYLAWMRRGKKAKGAADWRQGSFLGVIDLVQLFASRENIFHCRVIFVPAFDTVDVISCLDEKGWQKQKEQPIEDRDLITWCSTVVDLLQLFCHWKTIRPQLSMLLSFGPKHFLIFVDVVYAGCDS